MYFCFKKLGQNYRSLRLKRVLNSIFPQQSFELLEAEGRSIGLVVEWNDCVEKVITLLNSATIIKFHPKELKMEFYPENICGAYYQIWSSGKTFWIDLFSRIEYYMGGDMIFVLEEIQIWGEGSRSYPLVDFLSSTLEEKILCHIELMELTPNLDK